MEIGVFGHGVPYRTLSDLGIAPVDVTLNRHADCPAVASLIEPFMDPFAASFLNGLAGGALDHFDAIVMLRESPGALHAHQYGVEFGRRGMLGDDAPQLRLFNLIASAQPSVQRFNDRSCADLRAALGGPLPIVIRGKLDGLVRAQAAGEFRGAEAFDQAFDRDGTGGLPPAGPRLALLGAPLGDSALHRCLERFGRIVFDQQIADLAAATDDPVANPFGARQSADLYLDAIAEEFSARQVDQVVWQVDPQDDLWGWLRPDVARLAATLGLQFLDLGFLPRWPSDSDLVDVTRNLDLGEPG